MLPVVLIGVGGFLFGGAWTMRSQNAPRPAIVIVALLALIALAAGILWMLPKGTFS